MGILTASETAAWLRQHDNYTILTHRRPDCDTLGSAALLCRGLRAIGKTAHVLENPETTPKYQFVVEGLTKPKEAEGDTILCVDVAIPGLLPDAFMHLADKIALRIDHHRNNGSYTPYEYNDAVRASCAQVVYDVLEELGVELDIPMADAMYVGISTDTGCFQFGNTKDETFMAGALCARVTPNLPKLNRDLFATFSLTRLKLQGWIVENAHFTQGGKVCVCGLSAKTLEELGVTEDDLENIAGFPRSIQGVVVSATLREESDGKLKLSVRCPAEINAEEICKKFGGGGHKGAAAAVLDMPLEEAIAAVQAMIPEI